MPRVIISANAERAIRAHADCLSFRRAPQNADGTYTIDLQFSTIARLREAAFPGENLSDTIERVCAFAAGKGLS